MDRRIIHTEGLLLYCKAQNTHQLALSAKKDDCGGVCESQKPNYIQKKKEEIETPRHGDSQRRATEGE
jgi:hypothetical protein